MLKENLKPIEPTVSTAASLAGIRPRPHLNRHQNMTLGLWIGTLGVVYGDIGTSPLYAMSEAFFGHYPLSATQENIFGVVSLVFWSLVLVVTVKYVGLILRANNNGEGGIFALLGLLLKHERTHEEPVKTTAFFRSRNVLLAVILIGASLLYGDGIITPAISVMSAVEGLSIALPAAKSFQLPVTVSVLIGLFMIQKRGTHRIGWLFGPIMAIWFILIATLGTVQIAQYPQILAGLNPWYAFVLARQHGWQVMFVLGSVVLCVTGVEAMYADLGHFGRTAITRSWSFIVLPCLLLNYFGQGAFMLSGKPVLENHLFYALAPGFLMLPTVIMATMATVIASQALISGAFSLTQQAIALGLFPRIRIVHTNPNIPGQIYLPFINSALLVGCIWLVLAFENSTNLAAAYGLAVTGTMTATTIVFSVVGVSIFKWRKRWFLPLLAVILLIDLAFLGSNLLKFSSGGYVPILIGFAVFIIMDTWRWGRQMIGRAYQERLKSYHLSVQDIVDQPHETGSMSSVSVVVMASRPIVHLNDFVPPVLVVHYANWRQLPKHIVFLSILQTGQPYEPDDERYQAVTFVRSDKRTVISVQAKYGYMEQPNIRQALIELKQKNMVKLPLEPKRWLVLVGAERFITPGNTWIEKFRIGLFSRMNRLAKPAIDYFGLATDSAVVAETINV